MCFHLGSLGSPPPVVWMGLDKSASEGPSGPRVRTKQWFVGEPPAALLLCVDPHPTHLQIQTLFFEVAWDMAVFPGGPSQVALELLTEWKLEGAL